MLPGRAVRDGQWELFDYDMQTGRSVWATADEDGRTTYRIDYPAQALIDHNAAVRNMDRKRSGWGTGKAVAEIPLNIFQAELAEAHRQGDRAHIKRWLNDSGNAAFRTFEGRV